MYLFFLSFPSRSSILFFSRIPLFSFCLFIYSSSLTSSGLVWRGYYHLPQTRVGVREHRNNSSSEMLAGSGSSHGGCMHALGERGMSVRALVWLAGYY
ncbi:hypothetical protein IWZ01DRAFT_247822 [Phyllosticta capitalensis]